MCRWWRPWVKKILLRYFFSKFLKKKFHLFLENCLSATCKKKVYTWPIIIPGNMGSEKYFSFHRKFPKKCFGNFSKTKKNQVFFRKISRKKSKERAEIISIDFFFFWKKIQENLKIFFVLPPFADIIAENGD